MPMRLLAVADVYEALTSERPYRAAMRSEEALRSSAPRRRTGSTRTRPWPSASLAHDTAAPVETGPSPHNEERIGGVLDRQAARSASDDA